MGEKLRILMGNQKSSIDSGINDEWTPTSLNLIIVWGKEFSKLKVKVVI